MRAEPICRTNALHRTYLILSYNNAPMRPMNTRLEPLSIHVGDDYGFADASNNVAQAGPGEGAA
ncbi:hypothetical protein GCM10011400_33350 [Paraburkholderia caffeinilytica]|uniref:Uncharacterized protein n=1 Tax=Paraburkholderia caffeinilytica TaxID=1761016 RepID=A0ABQ1MN04_9BURK|nr:hypothetical protein GCM10011400_33350 [Paraburkholderia caffeinilytica]